MALFATTTSLGSGSSGGIFSPSLFMGATLGGAFASALIAIHVPLPIDVPAFAIRVSRLFRPPPLRAARPCRNFHHHSGALPGLGVNMQRAAKQIHALFERRQAAGFLLAV